MREGKATYCQTSLLCTMRKQGNCRSSRVPVEKEGKGLKSEQLKWSKCCGPRRQTANHARTPSCKNGGLLRVRIWLIRCHLRVGEGCRKFSIFQRPLTSASCEQGQRRVDFRSTGRRRWHANIRDLWPPCDWTLRGHSQLGPGCEPARRHDYLEAQHNLND